MSSNGAATGPDTPEWSELLAKPRLLVTEVRRNDVPRRPGVYAWFRDGECMYLGRASDLRSRLGTHLGTSLDLSRSTLRSWVAVRELGLAREYTRRRPTVMTGEQVAIVNGWIRGCELAWMSSDTREDAAGLEARLLAAHSPPINVA